jgi:hypothetical protein
VGSFQIANHPHNQNIQKHLQTIKTVKTIFFCSIPDSAKAAKSPWPMILIIAIRVLANNSNNSDRCYNLLYKQCLHGNIYHELYSVPTG